MNRAKLLPIWDNDVPHKLHVELDVIFKALAALASPADALVAGDRVDAANVVKLTDEQYLKILEPVLSRYGMQRYLNGDEITLDPSDYRAIINAAIQAQKDGHG